MDSPETPGNTKGQSRMDSPETPGNIGYTRHMTKTNKLPLNKTIIHDRKWYANHIPLNKIITFIEKCMQTIFPWPYLLHYRKVYQHYTCTIDLTYYIIEK